MVMCNMEKLFLFWLIAVGLFFNQAAEAFYPANSGVVTASRSRLVQLTHDLEFSKNGHCFSPDTTTTSLSAFENKPRFQSFITSTTTDERTTSSKTAARPIASPGRSRTESTSKGLMTSATRNAVQFLLVATVAMKQVFRSSETLETVWGTVKETSESLASNLSGSLDSVWSVVAKYWWSHPLFLALVPIVTNFLLGIGDASMPHWWPVTRMDHILASPNAALVIGFFLWSNMAYFVSGAYLVKKFPPILRDSNNNQEEQESTNILSKLKQFTRMVPTRQTWLGLLLLLAGAVSTIFHTEQALGSYAVANSLCYIDHAIAGTSTFYFFHTCNRPSKTVWALGIAGLAALSIPLPGYAWLHSLWHFLSAGAAVLWALESFAGQETPVVSQINNEPIAAASAVTHTPATEES